MKHHCHCGFWEHFKLFRVKKLGFVGGVFLVLHLLFHVIECLILPSILVGLGGHLAEEPVSATNGEPAVIESSPETNTILPRYALSTHTDIPVYDIDIYRLRL